MVERIQAGTQFSKQESVTLVKLLESKSGNLLNI